MHDYRGRRDAYGYKLHATEECVADELACVAGLVCGKNTLGSRLYNSWLPLPSRPRVARIKSCVRRRRDCSVAISA